MRTEVVFDIGDVLVEWRPQRLYERLIADAAERDRFFAEICPTEWNARFDAGEPMPEGVEAHAARHPAHADLIRAWWSRWPEMLGPAIEASQACFAALKAKGTRVHGLSNFAAETFEIARKMYPILDRFDVLVVSAHVKTIKPEPRIYEILEQRTGAAPEALYFIDDRPENVAAARARGWRAHLFRGAAGLMQAMVEDGLLEPHELPPTAGEDR